MNAETKPMDVPAVMDDAIADYCHPTLTDRGGVGPELIKARAAFAELIESAPAMSDYLDWQCEKGGDPAGLDIAKADIARFRAALARVQGCAK